MIDKNNPVPLYIQIKNDLLKNIKEGLWDVDTQLPTEKELMQKYDVGRATVRDAISILVNEGYLFKRKGVGTFVARKQPALGFEPLISLTYSLKALGIDVNNTVIKKEEIKPNKKLLEKLRGNKSSNYYYLKRLRSVSSKPIAIEHSYFLNGFKYIGNNFDLTSSLAKMILRDLSLTIKKIDQTIVLRAPTKAESKELKIDNGTILLDLERWIYIEEEESPFYYLKFVIPSEIYTYPFINVTEQY
ncbi:GntR family transcriptional regulator [Brassicibacter mesophilus]|uniref:GntR family transcriptional regulator n=1 Tax=Brassicibacter mesophilus TaxID=745119 RepID=UPI003D1FDCE4